MRRLSHLVVACFVVASVAATVAYALDCPHCPNDLDEPGFGSQVCATCHITHSSYGTLLNPAKGATITNLCQSCHNSGGPGAEVHGHMATDDACSFCVRDFTTTCTDCHDVHSHDQPYDDPTDPGTSDNFIASAVRVTLGGVTCTDECPDGQYPDPAGGTGCLADEVCDVGSCVGSEVCDASSGVITCTCPVNYDPADCTTCATGYSGAGCPLEACAVESASCANGHGTCTTAGAGDCAPDCPGGEYNDPKNQGTCTTIASCPGTCTNGETCDNTHGEEVCTCPVGYTGVACDSCAAGFTGYPTCTAIACTADGNPCGYGTCSGGGSGCTADCTAGEHNEQSTGTCVTDETCPGTCVNQQTCDATHGVAVCNCGIEFNGGACDACATGFSGYPSCTADSCSAAGNPCGHGTCADSCGGDCLAGDYNVQSTGVCTTIESCTNVCQNGGTCDNSHGPAVCACPLNTQGATCSTCATTGYTGGSCTPVVCEALTENQPCGHGTCTSQTGTGSEQITLSNDALSITALGGWVENTAASGANDPGTGADAIQSPAAATALDVSVTTVGSGTFNVWVAHSRTSGAKAGNLNLVVDIDSTNVGTLAETADNAWIWELAGSIALTAGPHTVSFTCTAGQYKDSRCNVDGLLLTTEATNPNTDAGFTPYATALWDDSGLDDYVVGGTTYECQCPDGYIGTNCDQCDTGYEIVNGSCQLISDPCSGITCDNRGTCYENWDGSAVCDCNERFYGTTATQCDLCDFGGGLTCNCAAGYAGALCDQCDAGYVEVDGACVLDPCSGVSCDGVGTCYVDPAVTGNAICDCDGTYYGTTVTQCDLCAASGPTTVTLYPTTNTPSGTVGFPTEAYADDSTPATVSSSNSSLVLSGFDSTDLGTITDVVVWVDYKTSAAPGNDQYGFQAALDGSTFDQTIVAYNVTHQSGYTQASLSLGVLTWADVGALAVRADATRTGGADGYTVDWDVAYLEVTYEASSFSCGCQTGYTGTWCDQCATGYVPYAGGCIDDPCDPNPCGGGGVCYVDSGGQPVCDCPGQYWGTACDQCSLPGPLECVCSAGYGPTDDCSVCQLGYHEENGACVPDPGVCAGVTCSGHGTCVVNDSVAECVCSGHYYGADCSQCDATGGATFRPIVLTAQSGPGSFADGDPTDLGLCEACHTATMHHTDTGDDGSHYPATNCLTCHSHMPSGDAAGYGFTPEETQTCASCHLSPPGGGNDADSFAWDGTKALIDLDEWNAYGHGSTDAYPSTTAGAGFRSTQNNGCAYCHDAAVPHDAVGNFFRLDNWDIGEGANGTCLICHGSNYTGYDPGTGFSLIDGTDIDAPPDAPNHAGNKHGADTGGLYCWDCHDPHGDTDGGGAALWYMVQRQPFENADPDGLPVEFAATVTFRADLAGDTGVLDLADYTAGGLCKNCHDDGAVGHFTKNSSDTHPAEYSPAPGTRCTECHPHNKGFIGVPPAGQTCATCHMDGTAESLSYSFGDARSYIDATEWTSSGHGRTSGTYASSRPAANFDVEPENGCAYCHATAIDHEADPNNFFRLANQDFGGFGPNGTCLVCHEATAHIGYTPPDSATEGAYTARDATETFVETAHYGSAHGGANENGGEFCWNCHDPHGDPAAGGGENWYMMQNKPMESCDAYGLPTAATLVGPITFQAAGADLAFTDYYDLCSVCHDDGVVGHYNKLTQDGHTGGQASGRCTDCHTHTADFEAGGDCTVCHASVANNNRRAVMDDFVAAGSHHVMRGGGVNKYDCVLCHREATESAGLASGIHGNGIVDLRDVDDSTNTAWTWTDNDTVVNTPNAANCASPNERTAVSLFCMSCHDTDGVGDTAFLGNVIAAENTELNPGWTRSGTDPFASGISPMDVNAQFDTSWLATHGASCWYNAGWTSGQKPPSLGAINAGAWVNSWGNTATTECADCHMPGGTDGTVSWSANAHGTVNTGWLLDDSDGLDTVMIGAASGLTSTVTCLKCHNREAHVAGGSLISDSRFGRHSTGSHHADGDVYSGIGCMNCHAGWQFGSIHGGYDYRATDKDGFGAYDAYGFLNGAALDYWMNDGAGNITCSTEGKGDTVPNTFNLGCKQHSSQSYTRTY